MNQTGRPSAEDYAPYYDTYIKLVPDGNIVKILRDQLDSMMAFFETIPNDKWHFSYRMDKWTVAQVVHHIIDVERVMSYRALRFARRDLTPLPSFDQDLYIQNLPNLQRSQESLVAEYKSVRSASISLFSGFDPSCWIQKGIASGFNFTTQARAFVIAGHELHHRRIIQDRYLT